ncbi:hypothetical protein NMQ01_10915 [Janibacter sp. CX7]|uniref:hypothetical protein n=1 Tax=unclassified Janibacter TaxID=2649294 RepID=UPI0020CDECA0|nr:hypothetical protein [Janibacter sp. CX7]UTT65223.1 hypothetical protein NMQ01_10915 [Janibacter sp. CX7]
MLEIVGGVGRDLTELDHVDLVVIAIFAVGRIRIEHEILEAEEDPLEDRVANVVPRRASDVIVA